MLMMESIVNTLNGASVTITKPCQLLHGLPLNTLRIPAESSA